MYLVSSQSAEEALFKRCETHFRKKCLDPVTGLRDPARVEKAKAEGGPYLSKDSYLHRIKSKGLPLHYRGFIVESYGAFGKEAWDFIHKVAKRDTVGESSGGFNPWGRPEWKRHFTLSIGFAIQRGNAAMLIRSDQRRRANTNFRASGPTMY